MTDPDFRARLHALISHYVTTATEPMDAADELLAEAIAANAASGDRACTAALLRKFADQLDRANG